MLLLTILVFLFACATFPSRFGLLNITITNHGKDCSRRNCKWIKNSKCVFTSRYWRSFWLLNEACWQSQCCYGGHSLLTGRYFKHCYCCYYFILFFGWEYLFDFSSQNYVNKLWLEIFFSCFEIRWVLDQKNVSVTHKFWQYLRPSFKFCWF